MSNVSKLLVCLALTSTLVLIRITTAIAQSDAFQRDIPAEAVTQVNRARTARLKNDAQGAIQILLPLTRQYPKYFSAHYGLGLAYQREGQTSQAIIEIKEALRIREAENLKDYTIYNSLGWLYLTLGRYKEAQTLFSKAASFESLNSRETNSRIFNNLGLADMYLGQYQLAEQSFIKAGQYGGTTASSNLKLLKVLEKSQPIAAHK